MRAKHIMGPFEGFFEELETFWAILGPKKLRAPQQNTPRKGPLYVLHVSRIQLDDDKPIPSYYIPL